MEGGRRGGEGMCIPHLPILVQVIDRRRLHCLDQGHSFSRSLKNHNAVYTLRATIFVLYREIKIEMHVLPQGLKI